MKVVNRKTLMGRLLILCFLLNLTLGMSMMQGEDTKEEVLVLFTCYVQQGDDHHHPQGPALLEEERGVEIEEDESVNEENLNTPYFSGIDYSLLSYSESLLNSSTNSGSRVFCPLYVMYCSIKQPPAIA